MEIHDISNNSIVSDGGKIKRPPNAFILFSNDWRKKIAEKYPGENNNFISKRIGDEWKTQNEALKQDYKAKAHKLEQLHKLLYPSYVYNPKEARDRKNRIKMEKFKVNLGRCKKFKLNYMKENVDPNLNASSGMRKLNSSNQKTNNDHDDDDDGNQRRMILGDITNNFTKQNKMSEEEVGDLDKVLTATETFFRGEESVDDQEQQTVGTSKSWGEAPQERIKNCGAHESECPSRFTVATYFQTLRDMEICPNCFLTSYFNLLFCTFMHKGDGKQEKILKI